MAGVERRTHSMENYDAYVLMCAARDAARRGHCPELTVKENAQVLVIYKEARRLNILHGANSYHVDHIHPLAKGGAHHPDNLRIITAAENLAKGAKLVA